MLSGAAGGAYATLKPLYANAKAPPGRGRPGDLTSLSLVSGRPVGARTPWIRPGTDLLRPNGTMDLGARDANVGEHAVIEALEQAGASADLPPAGNELSDTIDQGGVHADSPERLRKH